MSVKLGGDEKMRNTAASQDRGLKIEPRRSFLEAVPCASRVRSCSKFPATLASSDFPF